MASGFTARHPGGLGFTTGVSPMMMTLDEGLRTARMVCSNAWVHVAGENPASSDWLRTR